MSSDHDIPVQCTRCRNKHMESERHSVPDRKFKNLTMTNQVCPRCGCRSYFNLTPKIAWCFASGQIEIGDVGTEPEGAIVIASGESSYIQGQVAFVARRTASGLVVPGLSEIVDQKAKGDALAKWLSWAAEGNGKKHRNGVIFYSEENKYVV